MAPPEDEAEDFSFPPITNTPPRFFESPPLWRPSSSSSAALYGDDDDDDQGTKEDDREEEQQRMDVLWEDLNEENARSGGLVSGRLGISSELNEKCGCLQLLGPSKGNGKKPSVLVFVKFLQKLLLVRNTRRPIQKRAW